VRERDKGRERERELEGRRGGENDQDIARELKKE
jgi:hypothetical protein